MEKMKKYIWPPLKIALHSLLLIAFGGAIIWGLFAFMPKDTFVNYTSNDTDIDATIESGYSYMSLKECCPYWLTVYGNGTADSNFNDLNIAISLRDRAEEYIKVRLEVETVIDETFDERDSRFIYLRFIPKKEAEKESFSEFEITTSSTLKGTASIFSYHSTNEKDLYFNYITNNMSIVPNKYSADYDLEIHIHGKLKVSLFDANDRLIETSEQKITVNSVATLDLSDTKYGVSALLRPAANASLEASISKYETQVTTGELLYYQEANTKPANKKSIAK